MLPESLNDAYVEAIKALGGSKSMGVELWPSKGIEAAQRHLLACLNPDRHEKLSPEEGLLIERMARDRGCHVVMQFRSHAPSYAEPVPIKPRDETDQLRRELLEIGRDLQTKLAKLEAMDRPALRSAA